MIDFIKLELTRETGERLLTSKLLDFKGEHNRSTGEIREDCALIAEYGPSTEIGRTEDNQFTSRALKFKIYPSGRTILQGSWHKYDQDGENCGQYYCKDFSKSVVAFCEVFEIDPKTAKILQLESGVNVIPPISTKLLIKQIICHRAGDAFSPMRTTKGRPIGVDLNRNEYRIKIYQKGLQYRLLEDLLRFECKFLVAQLKLRGIRTLHDLLNPVSWSRLSYRVLEIYDEIFIAEPSIDKHSLSVSNNAFTTLATAPIFWSEGSKQCRLRAKKRYEKIIERFAENNLKKNLREIIEGTYAELIGSDLLDKNQTMIQEHEKLPFVDSVKSTFSPLLHS